ncbi:transcriptional regulator family: Fungal Specific TF [Paecilomyces variotii]|nr:transcriptional regulator family: Fungal Specific TF [Paecilomyces variotii]
MTEADGRRDAKPPLDADGRSPYPPAALDSVVSTFSPAYDLPYQNSSAPSRAPNVVHRSSHHTGDANNVPDGVVSQQPSDATGLPGSIMMPTADSESSMGATVPTSGQDSLNNFVDDGDAISPSSSRDPGTAPTDGNSEGRNPEQGSQNDGEKPPPWSELKTKAGKERKRLPLACIACRRKKIRCSGEKPACKHCFRSRIPCVYKVTTRKAAPRTDYMAMLDKRLKRMEDRVIKAIPRDEPRDLASIGRAVVKPAPPGQTPKAPKTAQKKRSADEAFAAELDEWTRGPKTTAPDPIPANRNIRQPDASGLLTEGAEFLPPMEIQEHLAEVFFDCVYGQSYLLLHKPSFMRRLKAGTIPPVLILAVCAVSARFSTHPEVSSEPAFQRGENWANPAAAIALSRHDEPNITILTVFLLLGLHEFGTCHGGRSWSFGGQALRMAYALQLHRELDHDPLGQNNSKTSEISFTDREIRRRTMWACVLMDRYNSSGSQRPPIGNEKFLHIQLPVKESHFQMEIPGPTEDLDGNVPNPVPEGYGQLSNPKDNMGVSAYIIRAIMLWGRIVDYLNLGGKKKDPHPLWSPESGYSRLKRQIEEFSASLPSFLAFTLENLQNHAAEKVANQFLFLHMIIHQNVLFLNQFAIPLSPGVRPPKDMPKAFLSDAGRAAVEAAHHISLLIDRASGYLLTVPFAGYCAYSASTVHIWGIFSKNAQLEARSKENLRHTYRYLNKMKRYWGMFHYMVESAKDRYRQFADAAIKGTVAHQSRQGSPMFQYGDWFDKYPHGVAQTHWQDLETNMKKETGEDAVMAQRPDLQSVEEFFASLSPTPRTGPPRKQARKQDRTGTKDAPTEMMPPPAPNFDAVTGLSMATPQAVLGAGAPDFNQQQMYQSPFDVTFTPDHLPQLDRQLVYGAYAGLEPTMAHNQMPVPIPSEPAAPQNGAAVWGDPFAMNGTPAGTGEFFQPSAWFLPFNLDPVGAGMSMDGSPPDQTGGGGNMMSPYAMGMTGMGTPGNVPPQ